ncbi:hypothetical protein L7F22_036983 [Adiantum nelumboides]|nr:hypothetical protein [Adiantum nelumboides]
MEQGRMRNRRSTSLETWAGYGRCKSITERMALLLNKPYPFLINDPAAGSNVVDTLVDLLLEPIRPTLVFQLRALEACCHHPQVIRHLYGSEERKGAEACAALQALILASEVAQRGVAGPRMLPIGQGLSRLQTLCCRLQAIVAGGAGDAWTTSNIYAGNTLVSLLCQAGEQELGQEIVACLGESHRPSAAQSREKGGAALLLGARLGGGGKLARSAGPPTLRSLA